MQHDRSVRPVEVSHVLDVMETANEHTVCTDSGRVNYVGFPTTTTLSHRSYVASKYGLAVEPVTRDVPDPKVDGSKPGRSGTDDHLRTNDERPSTLKLLPLVQFYDSMHVASTRWYLSRVFGRSRYVNLPRGGFIEDTGQHMLRTIREECAGPKASDANAVARAHAAFGTFAQDDSRRPSAATLTGRRFDCGWVGHKYG